MLTHLLIVSSAGAMKALRSSPPRDHALTRELDTETTRLPPRTTPARGARAACTGAPYLSRGLAVFGADRQLRTPATGAGPRVVVNRTTRWLRCDRTKLPAGSERIAGGSQSGLRHPDRICVTRGSVVEDQPVSSVHTIFAGPGTNRTPHRWVSPDSFRLDY